MMFKILATGLRMRIDKLLPELIKTSTFKQDIIKYTFKETARLWDKTPVNDRYIQFEEQSDSMLNMCIRNASSDESSMSVVKNYQLYERHQGTDYVVDKDFFRCFKQISLDKVQFKHLPRDQYGYIELPEKLIDEDGDGIKGFFFSICKVTEWYNSDKNQSAEILAKHKYDFDGAEYCFSLAWFFENGAVGFATHPIADDEIYIKDFLKTSMFTHSDVTRDIKDEVSYVDGFNPACAVMINLLAYLNSGDPDLRQYRNPIKYRSPTSTKPVRKDQELTQKDLTLLGFNWKKSALYTKESWYVPPYWANRRYGPGRELEKLVLVAGSNRNRKDI